MSKEIDKITRVLIQPNKNIVLKLHCKTTKTNHLGVKQDCNNVFEYGGNNYLKLDHSVFLTLEIVSDEWDKSKNLLITSKNIHQVQQSFRTMINVLKGDIFKVKQQRNENSTYMELHLFGEDIRANTMVIKMLGDSTSRLGMMPCILEDECQVQFEGVRLMVNKQANIVELTLEEFEALYYTIKNVDLFLYGQSMINYYMTHIKDKVLNPTPLSTSNAKDNNTKQSVFKNEVKSNFVKPLSDKDVFMM